MFSQYAIGQEGVHPSPIQKKWIAVLTTQPDGMLSRIKKGLIGRLALVGFAVCIAGGLTPASAQECLSGGCAGGSRYPPGTFTTTSSSFTPVATDIWAGEYAQYNVTVGASYEWSLCSADGGNASYDSQLTLYNNLGFAICYSDDACGDDAKIGWTATYTGFAYVQVNQYNCATNTTNTTLRWRQSSPAPDPCVAINIPSAPVINQSLVCASYNLLNAANVPAVCGTAGNAYKGGNEALYTFTPSVSGTHTISIAGQTWTSIYVYSGACPASGGTCVGSVGSSASSKSLNVTLTAGTLYYIWFDTYPTPTSPCPGTFSITSPGPAGPANDACSSATTLSLGTTAATSVGATGSAISSCGFFDSEDVWYTATNSSTVPRRFTISTGSSSFDPVLSVFTGNCSSPVELACDDNGGPGTESLITLDCVAPGEQLFIRLAGYNGSEGTTTLTFASVPDPVAPTLTCPANITVNADPGYCDAYVNYLPPWADSSGAGNYTGGGIPYNPIAGSGTSVSLGDDALSGAITIPFPFNFYGNSYTSIYFSSNGFLTFDALADDGCCSGQDIPDVADPNNLIAFAWEDLSPNLGGTIQYFTSGSAPNRIFVVNYNNIQHFGGGNPVTTQIQLKEGVGIIEIHTTSMPSDGGVHTMGIENSDGYTATYVTGRNAADWSASNEAIQFIPPNSTNDNCDGAYSDLIAGNGFTAFFDVGTTTETYQITDAAGNTQTCSFTVTVVDNQAPFVNVCPPAVINAVSDESGCGGKVVNYTQQFGDNCFGYIPGTLMSGLASGSVFPIGTTSVSWQFDDGVNTPATCSFNVVVSEPTTLSTALNLTNGCGTCTISDGQVQTIKDGFGNYIMTLEDDLALPAALGNTTFCNLAAGPTALDEFGDPVPVLTRFWRVTPTVNGPAEITVHFTNAEYDAMRTHPSAIGIYAISGLGDLCFTKYANGTPPGFASPGGVVVNVTSITDNGDGTISAVLDMTSFSDIYCHACNPFGGPLPIELVSFYGEQVSNINKLYWNTATEVNVSHFQLERSSDGKAFIPIGQVQASGNSTSPLSYHFNDLEFPAGGNYYRLRSIDLDESEELSSIIFLGDRVIPSLEWKLFPNPASDQIQIALKAGRLGSAQIRIVDMLGRVQQIKLVDLSGGEQSMLIDISNLPEGMYYMELETDLGLVSAKNFIKLNP